MSILSRWFHSAPNVSREPLPAAPPAPPWPAQGLWARAAYARLSDWFKHDSGWTLDLRKIIYDARLPEPLPGLIYLGVRRSRRSRRRRVELARELVLAFSAALEAGRAPRQIADDFRERESRGDYLPASKRRVRIEADLPQPVVQWIERAAARARLAPATSQRAAAKLAEHFAARLAAGESVDVLLERVGAAEHAARLLRQTELPSAVLLPPPLRALLDEVLRRARLWPSERRDVACELTDHFSDGMAAGCTPERLAADFGEPRQAARLIRRAKLRNRPLAWRMLRRSTQAMAAVTGLLLLTYCWLAVRYAIGRPTVSHHYITEINREQQSIPPDERAWPLYREALLQLPSQGRPDARGFERNQEGEQFWPEVVAYLDEHHETLALTRRAASRPQFGFIFGDPANREFLQKFAAAPDAHGESPERYNRFLIECTLPHHQETHFLARLLEADARRAVERGDSETLISDIVAMIGIAEQSEHAAPFIVVKLISSAIYEIALRTTATVLADRPRLCTDEQLKQVAHAIAGYAGGGTLRWSLDGDREMLYDYLQRTFTDDGQGDGRLTPAGFQRLYRDFSAAGTAQDRWTLAWRTWGVELGLGGPLLSAEVASRKELTELADRLCDEAEADYARPLWQWQKSAAEQTFEELLSSRLKYIRYWPVLGFFAGTVSYRVPFVPELTTQRRDAVLAAIALELHRRRHGAWPATLEELTPGLLPETPLDRFTGRPLRYRLVDGRPLLYSCGTDGDDDGGQAPKEGNSRASSWEPQAKLDAETIATDWAAANDGDWILWPAPANQDAN